MKSSIGPDEIQQAIISHPGPFVTAKLVYCKFSSRTRPNTEPVKTEMRYLEEIGLGKMAILDCSDFFFKALPTDVQQDSLSEQCFIKYHVLVLFESLSLRAYIAYYNQAIALTINHFVSNMTCMQ